MARGAPAWGAAAVVLALLLLAPAADAIHRGATLEERKKDRDFVHHFNVQGRIVNQTGWPMADVPVSATLLGLTAVDATDCGGDFSLWVPLERPVSRFDEVVVEAAGQSKRLALGDAEYTRRTDAVFTVGGRPPASCVSDQTVQAWFYRYSVEGRLVERSPEYERDGVTLQARPVVGEQVKMAMLATWLNQTGVRKTGVYEARTRGGPIVTDAGGNFVFSFTVADEVDGGFKVSAQNVTKMNVTLADRTIDVTEPDFHHRYTFLNVVRGMADNSTPAPPAWALLAGAAVGAMLLARRRAP